jgi:acylphosphatase
MTASGAAIRRTALFTGRVQGVGFRFMTCSIARHHAVTGFVRNLSDGSVEAVIEGAREVTEDLIDAVKTEMGTLIRDVKVVESSATGEFARFDIRY